MLRSPTHVGPLYISNGKGLNHFNFVIRALWNGTKIDRLCTIVKTRDTNVSYGSQCISWPKKTSCGKILVLFKRNMPLEGTVGTPTSIIISSVNIFLIILFELVVVMLIALEADLWHIYTPCFHEYAWRVQ